MTRKDSSRMRWVSLLGLVMMLMSSTPMGVAAQVGLTPVGDVAQGAGQAIELLLVDCPPGAPEDPSDLIPGCTDGRANLNISVTSVDPVLGVDLPKVSVKPSDPGPGVINTGQIALGEYRIEIDLPEESNSFFYECRLRGTETAVPTSAPADGAENAFVVQNDANVDVVCQAWITPAGENPTLEITYRECSRGDFTDSNRTFEDLDANCTNISTDPPTFNVRHLDVDGDPVTDHQLDAQGMVELTLTPGDFDLFTDLDMNQWGEYLFCEYEGQLRYAKDFDPTRGITTFTDLRAGEEIFCDWFGVNASDAPSGAVDQAPQQDPVETETEGEVQEPQGQIDQNQQIQATDDAGVQFIIDYRECDQSVFMDDGRSHAQLTELCTTIPETGPTFTTQVGTETETHTLGADGVLDFTHPAVDFSIFTDLDYHQWGEYLFCEYDGQPLYPKPFTNGINGFTQLNDGEIISCDWFAVQAVDDDGDEPPVVPPVEGDRSINIDMRICEVDYEGASPETLAQMQIDCTEPVVGTLFTLTNDDTATLNSVTNEAGFVRFENLADDSWRLWSEIPLAYATEYYFCAAGDAPLQFFGLTDRGVAEFNAYTGQTINCEVYVVPENLRGDITGASVEVHLALCPANYEGGNFYGDCHDNGLDGYDFTLVGPAGEVTAPTVVERTPGPGIVTFTELPAGDYQLYGGPPQHDGTVFLYCSDPSKRTQVETTFEGGMGYFSLTENQSIVCDWYFTPVGEVPVTPTPEPELAEIFTTMFICPQGVNVAGSNFGQLDDACTQRLNDVPMTLQKPGGVPITANTGASGDGAIRFYDLLGGDYVLTPKLPSEYVSAAVYCDLDGGDVYQKALENGATRFVNVDGELISCSWFVTAKPQPAPGPTGSITIREMLCEGDRSTIKDWERECQPGSSGVSFTVTNSGGGVNQTLTPNVNGVAVFSGLPNDYYELKQSEGAWCRARAERVDAQSRVIVSGGGNTDVFLYQCNQVIGLPETGTGSRASSTPLPMAESIMLGAVSLPLFAIAAWQIRRSQLAGAVADPVQIHEALTRTRNGYRYR